MSDSVTKSENATTSAEHRDGITTPSPMSRAEAIQRLAAMGMEAGGGGWHRHPDGHPGAREAGGEPGGASAPSRGQATGGGRPCIA